ncbi:MAG TPA: hemolysin family protein [Candidatus Eisenbacteria bacterium]|nr:hemolysin family protein [Candidatus Eisenbacteria bacterium]
MVTFVVLRIAAVVLLVAANAFFVAAEFALVSVRETRLEQLIAARRIGARIVQKLHARLDDVLNAVQFGITIASLALGWIGETALAHVLEPLFRRLPYSAAIAHAIAITIAFVVITYLHVILGEVVPKSIALQRTEQVALAVAAPMDVFMTVAAPFLAVMRVSSQTVLKAFGVRQVREGGVHSPEELKLIVSASRRIGVLAAPQEQMIHRALDLENVLVREVMVPRPDIVSLPGDMSLDEAFQNVADGQHSRVPVFDPLRGPEHIIGVLYAKDLMRWLRHRLGMPAIGLLRGRSTDLKVRHIMREVLVVPETKALPDLLSDFKHRKRHLAVVVDEFGSTAGVVTVEDILEQLVGEIEDEFDVSQPVFAPGDMSMVLTGAVNIRDLESQYHVKLPRDQGFETLAGFVLTKLQRIPAIGDSFEFDGRRYTVATMDGLRVDSVRIDIVSSQSPAVSAAG